MKKVILVLVILASLGCYYDPNYNCTNDPNCPRYDPSEKCNFEVYQSGTVIDNVCKSCNTESYSSGSVYYFNTEVECTP